MRNARILTFLTLGALFASGCGYNRIQQMDEQVNQAKGQIAAQLQRRADLVPNLVATVKGYAAHEDSIFTHVADARAKLAGAVQGGNIQEMAAANQALTAPLGRLLAISENYPQLKADQNFRALQDELTGTENRIAVARQDYNTSVGNYNKFIRTFPYNLTAKMFGQSTPREYFQADQGAATAPKVQF
jgi:LemA protein